jgi:hypothetical protein
MKRIRAAIRILKESNGVATVLLIGNRKYILAGSVKPNAKG